MRSVHRALCLLLLALLLPLQGVAAVLRLHCDGGPDRLMPAGAGHAVHAPQGNHDPAAHHAHHAQDAPHHGHHAPMAADASAHPGTDTDSDSPHAGCSACAACGVALALPAAARLPGAPEARPAHPRVPGFPAGPFETGGPDRPPRA
jgi:hypothetical protein